MCFDSPEPWLLLHVSPCRVWNSCQSNRLVARGSSPFLVKGLNWKERSEGVAVKCLIQSSLESCENECTKLLFSWPYRFVLSWRLTPSSERTYPESCPQWRTNLVSHLPCFVLHSSSFPSIALSCPHKLERWDLNRWLWMRRAKVLHHNFSLNLFICIQLYETTSWLLFRSKSSLCLKSLFSRIPYFFF